MAEIRKPDFIMLLRFRGKKKAQKTELFHARQWGYSGSQDKYRIRLNGKWFMGKKGKPSDYHDYYTFYEFRDLLWKSIKGKF